MLKYLLSLLLLQQAKAANFTNEVDYVLNYQFETLGFYLLITTFKMNSDLYCDQLIDLYSDYIDNDANALNNVKIRSYNQNYIFSIKKADYDTLVNPECEIDLQVCDIATTECIAKQSIKYNDQTNTFSIGFFKATVPNAIIKSSVENELVIQNKFGMNNSSDA